MILTIRDLYEVALNSYARFLKKTLFIFSKKNFKKI
jgi:hypothetical protein